MRAKGEEEEEEKIPCMAQKQERRPSLPGSRIPTKFGKGVCHGSARRDTQRGVVGHWPLNGHVHLCACWRCCCTQQGRRRASMRNYAATNTHAERKTLAPSSLAQPQQEKREHAGSNKRAEDDEASDLSACVRKELSCALERSLTSGSQHTHTYTAYLLM